MCAFITFWVRQQDILQLLFLKFESEKKIFSADEIGKMATDILTFLLSSNRKKRKEK